MALYRGNLISSPTAVPSKNVLPLNRLILRTHGLILHTPSSTPLLSLFAKPISLMPYSIHFSATTSPQKYVYPDPIPEFAISETQKFRNELLQKLLKEKETFGDDFDIVVDVCVKVFSEFLHKEYGGPGTLLVDPFTDMFVALKENKLPGAPLAARTSLLWAQNNVDHDWEVWTSDPPN